MALTLRITKKQRDQIDEFFATGGRTRANLCGFIEEIAMDFTQEYYKVKKKGKEELLQLELLRYNVPRKKANVNSDKKNEKGVTTHLTLTENELDSFKEMAESLGFSTADLIRRLIDRRITEKQEEICRIQEQAMKIAEKMNADTIEGQISIDDFSVEEGE